MSCVDKSLSPPRQITVLSITSMTGRLWMVALACHRALKRRQERHALRELDDQRLADLGISREAANREADKWFWQ